VVWGQTDMESHEQAVEKRASVPRFAGFPSSFFVAATIQVRLAPQDFGRPCERDFARLNLHLPACA
jgi:hypothetical protein